MLKPEYTTRFKKDLKTVEKRNLDIELLKEPEHIAIYFNYVMVRSPHAGLCIFYFLLVF